MYLSFSLLRNRGFFSLCVIYLTTCSLYVGISQLEENKRSSTFYQEQQCEVRLFCFSTKEGQRCQPLGNQMF